MYEGMYVSRYQTRAMVRYQVINLCRYSFKKFDTAPVRM
jgi:hypothetical protein